MADRYEPDRAAVSAELSRAIAALAEQPADRATLRHAVWLVTAFRDAAGRAGELRDSLVMRVMQAEHLSLAQIADLTGLSKPRVADMVRTERQRQAARAPIVTAVVTKPKLGVLVGQRVDRLPPWTFIAGELETDLDEEPPDTAVREVKEETGLEISRASCTEIGRRVHPVTGRTMIYLAARPAGRATKITVGDEAELSEVRWVSSLTDLDDMMQGQIFGPVKQYLAQVLEP